MFPARGDLGTPCEGITIMNDGDTISVVLGPTAAQAEVLEEATPLASTPGLGSS